MQNTLETKVLRHIVPFYYEDSFGYEKLHEEIGKSGQWEEDRLEGCSEQDIYDYLLKELRYSQDKTNIGSIWKYVCREKEALKLAYLTGEASYIPIFVKDVGIFLFRSGIGFLWYELTLNQTTFTKEAFLEFQNVMKELNKAPNLDKVFRIVDSAIRVPVRAEDFCEADSEEAKTAVKCISRAGIKLLRQSALPAMPEGVERAIRYEIIGQQDMQLKYCGCAAFTLGNWAAELLENLPCRISFFASRKNCLVKGASGNKSVMVPDKALIFNYILMESEADTLSEENVSMLSQLAYHITSGYRESYLCPENYRDFMYHPFQNVYWYVTKEGCGCYAMSCNANADFFRSGMQDKVAHDYFILYMLMIHQSYTLLQYAHLIAQQLPADENEYQSDSAVYHETMETLTSRLNTFLVKGAYASVSHIEHQNGFYQYGIGRLHVKEDVESVSLGVDTLTEIQRRKYQERTDAEEKIEENNLTIGLGLLSLLAIFSAIADASSFIQETKAILAWKSTPEHIAWVCIYILICIAGIIAVYRFIKACIAQAKEKRNLKGKKKREKV